MQDYVAACQELYELRYDWDTYLNQPGYYWRRINELEEIIAEFEYYNDEDMY